MPKPHTYPTLYNEALQIDISKLKGWGYLTPGQIKTGTLKWSSNGNPTGIISIQVNTISEQPYIELDYKCNEAPINYRVKLVSVPSNLGKGVLWYFVCPHIGKRCRKLYLIDTYFYHRSAFRGCMYETQTYSKKGRLFKRLMDYEFGQPEAELNGRHFKCYYAGKPTKRYNRILKRIRQRQNIPYEEIRKFLLL